VVADPSAGTTGDQANAMIVMQSLLKRERFYSVFNMNKRYGLIRGDWMFHVYADPKKDAGSRISIFPLDPAAYFPIYNPDNINEIIGCHIVEQVFDPDSGKTVIDRLTYRKTTGRGGPSPITTEEALFETDKWGGPGMEERQVSQVLPVTSLPAPINQLPVYHIQNFQEPGSLFGSSEIRGLERLIAGINQAISDEELSLAMEGLGVYVSEAGSPIDEDTGEPVPWTIGPGRVVEMPNGKKFSRVPGITSLTPFGDHLKYLHGQLESSTGTSRLAAGDVDVEVAQSGIARLMELGPLFARCDEKETIITDVLTNMLFDLKSWFIAYEQTNVGDVIWLPKYGDRLPRDRAQEWAEFKDMAGITGLVSMAFLRSLLVERFGYTIDEAAIAAEIATEQTATAQIQSDVIGARLTAALNGGAPANPGAAGGQ
jgi:hypothetical protein